MTPPSPAMTYLSTRGGEAGTSFSDVLLRGIATDGGLYAPAHWPTLAHERLSGLSGVAYPDLVEEVLGLYAGGLPQGAIAAAARRLRDSFTHPAVTPLVQLEPNLWLLELFHGPTAAFKDLAMQLMAALLDAALSQAGERLLLLVATSGDTGAAAVAAFAGSPRISLAVLHPRGRVSEVQRRQMTTAGHDNILNLAIEGDFDDCQQMVKSLLADEELRGASRLSSVNSINWGRLVGQVPYYLSASSALGAPDRPVTFVAPTGNFGDAFAGWIARRMGAPIGPVVAALNSNDSLARLIRDGRYTRRHAVETASVSMDVQAPSNLERLVFEASGRDAARTANIFARFAEDGAVEFPSDIICAMRSQVSAHSVDEVRTHAEIARAWTLYGRVICPHTAVALAVAREQDPSKGPVIALATAHPAKFPQPVSRAIGFAPELPAVLQQLSEKDEIMEVFSAHPALVTERIRHFQRGFA